MASYVSTKDQTLQIFVDEDICYSLNVSDTSNEWDTLYNPGAVGI